MSSLVLSRALTSADDGSHQWTVTATQGGQSVQAVLAVSIVPAVLPHPVSITLDPASVSLPDNSPAGMMLSTPTITMSDGSTFSGTVDVTDENGNPAPVTFQA